MAQHVYEGTAQELAPFLAQRPKGRFRLIELEEDQEPTEEAPPNKDVLTMLLSKARTEAVPTERDPDLVARVRSVRGKYARTDGVSGSEELHQERQRDKAREEAKITGYKA